MADTLGVMFNVAGETIFRGAFELAVPFMTLHLMSDSSAPLATDTFPYPWLEPTNPSYSPKILPPDSISVGSDSLASHGVIPSTFWPFAPYIGPVQTITGWWIDNTRFNVPNPIWGGTIDPPFPIPTTGGMLVIDAITLTLENCSMGAAPAPPNFSVQFNNGGVFGGSNLLYNPGTGAFAGVGQFQLTSNVSLQTTMAVFNVPATYAAQFNYSDAGITANSYLGLQYGGTAVAARFTDAAGNDVRICNQDFAMEIDGILNSEEYWVAGTPGDSGTDPSGNVFLSGILIALGTGGGGMTIGDPVSGGTPGNVLFVDGGGNLADTNNLTLTSTSAVGAITAISDTAAATAVLGFSGGGTAWAVLGQLGFTRVAALGAHNVFIAVDAAGAFSDNVHFVFVCDGTNAITVTTGDVDIQTGLLKLTGVVGGAPPADVAAMMTAIWNALNGLGAPPW